MTNTRDHSPVKIAIRIIEPADVIPLRQLVLRPGQPESACHWPSDDDPTTAHFGAFVGGRLAGIASIYLEPQPGEADTSAWRLRGMATRPELRGNGIGGMLVLACIEHVENSGGRCIWCNARTPAVRFYERHGFRHVGDEFELPGIGPHFRMIRVV